MDFSLRTLFVVPVGNTLPTSGSTENLSTGQFGVFKDAARTACTAGNIATASWLTFAQGRPNSYLGSKISDKVKSTKVKQWYKVAGCATAANEIWDLSAFTAQCDQDITLTLRGHSQFLDTISFNGFTRSVTITTPCCDCGESPCDAVANETLIDLILQKIAQEAAVQNAPDSLTLSTFFTFTKVGTGSSAVLRIQSKPLTAYAKFCNIALNPYEYDRIYFRVWVYNNPDTSVDFLVYDRCEQAATATLVQRSSFPKGTSDQVYQEQIDYYSYQASYKHLFTQSMYNQQFEDYVTDGQLYDMYYLQFDELQQDDSFTANLKQDEMVMFAVPTPLSIGFEAVVNVYLGTPTNESGVCNTTTSTSTTSTSTSSTTTSTMLP